VGDPCVPRLWCGRCRLEITEGQERHLVTTDRGEFLAHVVCPRWACESAAKADNTMDTAEENRVTAAQAVG
jgi:uncharacterized 2Fe-2S/4Fe-4S cluster protein (DUF4445 family)